MRLWISAQSSFGVVVTMAKLRTHSPAGERQFSHRPASVNDAAIGERERIGLLLCFGLRHS